MHQNIGSEKIEIWILWTLRWKIMCPSTRLIKISDCINTYFYKQSFSSPRDSFLFSYASIKTPYQLKSTWIAHKNKNTQISWALLELDWEQDLYRSQEPLIIVEVLRLCLGYFYILLHWDCRSIDLAEYEFELLWKDKTTKLLLVLRSLHKWSF